MKEILIFNVVPSYYMMNLRACIAEDYSIIYNYHTEAEFKRSPYYFISTSAITSI